MQQPPRKREPKGVFAQVWIAYNELVDYCRNGLPVSGRGCRITRSSNGAIISVEDAAPQQSAGPANIKRMLVKSVQFDYLVCKEMTGSVGGGPDINVAKPFDLRRTGWDGVTVTYTIAAYPGAPATRNILYTFDSPILRRAAITLAGLSTTEYQEIIPYYVPDKSVIFAVEPENDTGIIGATWQDLNSDGRAWAKAV